MQSAPQSEAPQWLSDVQHWTSWGVTTGVLSLDCLSNSGAEVGHAVEQRLAQGTKTSASNK